MLLLWVTVKGLESGKGESCADNWLMKVISDEKVEGPGTSP